MSLQLVDGGTSELSCRDKITTGEQLPALPAGVPELLQVLMDDDLDYKTLAQTLGQFPSITARLLFLSNSAWAATSVPVTTVEAACAKLGLAVVRSVSVALSIASPFNPLRCPPFDAEIFWLSALLTADTAVRLARETRLLDETEIASLHTAGVLHNVGMLWLADQMPEQTAAALQWVRAQPVGVGLALKERCGLGFTEVGGYLTEAWSLPLVLQVAIREQANPDYDGAHWQMAALIGTATRFVKASEQMSDDLPENLYHEQLKLSEVAAQTLLADLPIWRRSMTKMVRSFLN